ncbi:minichromosome maintenance 5 protein [Artemisia annua]|uniref:Minichromosome maintenance 5 protein n=1 Tax=Artemisia annua TaxID=35608 RepID=A0A2U1L531_ARTAN|nr:minichromosome maintenance 5 protein [Artemisia annua]
MSIAEAAITDVLNSRTVTVAAANPPSGRYDDLKTAQDSIDLQTTILSRVDLIFIVKGIRMFKVYSSANAANDPRDTKDDNCLKSLSMHVYPVLSDYESASPVQKRSKIVAEELCQNQTGYEKTGHASNIGENRLNKCRLEHKMKQNRWIVIRLDGCSFRSVTTDVAVASEHVETVHRYDYEANITALFSWLERHTTQEFATFIHVYVQVSKKRLVSCGLKDKSLFLNEDIGLREDYDDMQLIRYTGGFTVHATNYNLFHKTAIIDLAPRLLSGFSSTEGSDQWYSVFYQGKMRNKREWCGK